MFNNIAETGIVPEDLTSGYLIPLHKQAKKKGKLESLRPVILLNSIRKILALIMLNRICLRVDALIPITQSAYRKGRGTTENVFTFKLLAEKAILEDNAEINIRLIDMSKAFDNVNREELLKDLKFLLEKDEIHMIKILITQLNLQIKNNSIISDNFDTSKGIPQGDSLSPLLFIYYLSQSLRNEHNNEMNCNNNPTDHNYHHLYNYQDNNIPYHLRDHNYSIKQRHGLEINLQFADDLSRINRYKELADEQIKNDIDKLTKRNFIINEEKTEKYQISKHSSEEWKKCKYLGSMLGNREDINRRKQLAMASYIKYKDTLQSNKLSLKLRCRLFKVYIDSIFLYNSETWTLSKKLNEEIDIFQRGLLKRMLKIHYPYTISNINLYHRVQMCKWSETIQQRRLKWTGHLLRMDINAPASIALEQTKKISGKRLRGNHITWIKQINNDLKLIDEDFNIHDSKLLEISSDRKLWYSLIEKASTYCRQSASAE